ncbi:M81 family metallopeptidase [Catenuloplanes japonicus]|uniref:M81 family metallopeptidase n=1 Tax=Catenuloplanes japonicus TaxID=33876 RepID=UPI0005257E01|nr:M81 family metallopeptidase [Catenuloplanes japonicus]
MRIAIAGLHIESSAYATHRASYRDFSDVAGAAVRERYDFLAPGTPLGDAAEWIGVFYARSIPGGRVEKPVYDDFKQRILTGLRDAGPLDGLYLDLHGAMSVDGLDDAEGDLVAAIREITDAIISAPMDLHGNVSARFAHAVELPTCYRLAPHEDAWETRERAARNLVSWLAAGARPHRAWVPVPILLPGEKTSTRVEPARSLYGSLAAVEQLDGVTDASIWIGYAWADEPRCHATVLVTGDSPDLVAAEAQKIAEHLWRVRDEFAFVGPPGTLAEGVSRALDAKVKPYLISDSGDNPGAGGSGDVTWTLSQLLAMPELTGPDAPITFVASVFDAPAIDRLFGTRLADVRLADGTRVAGELHSLHEGDPDAGRIAVIRVGGLHAILTEFRKAFHAVDDFTALGLDPRTADIVVTKIGYLEPTLHDIARGWTLALTPGAVDQDLARLGHHRIRRPMFPFDEFATDPDLTPRLLH